MASIKLNHLKRRVGWHLKRRFDSLQQKQEGVPAIVETTKDATLPAVVPPSLLHEEEGEDKEEPEVPLNGDSTCTIS